ncbi:hypothetical protein SUGI_0595960 [Cryptomeria japonica]|nr:hypothetical protein SUGI_0595960 [Cryptomeria japonica]
MRLFLQTWRPGFYLAKECFSRIPIWVRLPDQLLEYWENEVVTGIANSLGQLIVIDPVNISRKCLLFATFYMNIDVDKKLLSSTSLSSKYNV